MVYMKQRYLTSLVVCAALGACSASGEKSIAEAGATACRDPRPQVCTADYRPVCARLQGGGTKTYSNGCNACADAKVESWVENACPE